MTNATPHPTDVSGGSEYWRPSAPQQVIRARARLMADIRAYFSRCQVLEVETPSASVHGVTDPAIDSCQLKDDCSGRYLHTSPEFPMKRLLAAGSGAIFQTCRVFRAGERGRLHNPEFSLLEWYRPGFDHHRLMDDVASLLRHVSDSDLPETRLSYAELFEKHTGVDPHVASSDSLRQKALDLGLADATRLQLPDRDAWLDLLLTHCIEPNMPRDHMLFVYDYPVTQAALARLRMGEPPVAERFELYLGGMELANGFHELADPVEQRARFQAELEQRKSLGKPLIAMDEHLLDALSSGLPDCSGVALGLDRLLMWLCGATHIGQVLAFAYERS